MKKNKLLLIILLLAAIVRLWDLGGMPPHLRNDEASLGYNAYSILKTGKDEFGEFLPLLFRSFGDWKPGLYIYLTVPFVAILGLTEWSVRLPSVISGIIAVYLFYYLALCLFRNQKIALITALLVATSPWHIAFSRGAWEAQITQTLTIAGLVFLLKGLTGNKNWIFLSALFFGSTFLMSHSAKGATPLIILALLISYRRQITKIPLKTFFISCLIFFVLILPILLSFLNGKNSRFDSLFIFTKLQGQSVEKIAENLFKSWANHYSLSALFLYGDQNPQHTAADFGALLPIDLIFLFIGIKVFIGERMFKKEQGILILSLLILSPLSSSFTEGGNINYVRFLNFFIPLTLIVSLGLSEVKVNFLKITPFYLFFFLLFLDAYFIHSPAKSGAWQYGYKDLVKVITPIQSQYNKIYIPQGADQPYIFFLFFQKYPPEKLQQNTNLVFTSNIYNGMGAVTRVDNIEFVDLKKVNLLNNRPFLLVSPVNNNLTDLSLNKMIEIGQIRDKIGLPIYKILKSSL